MTTPDIWMAILDSLADDSENLKFINIGVKQWGISATSKQIEECIHQLLEQKLIYIEYIDDYQALHDYEQAIWYKMTDKGKKIWEGVDWELYEVED
ncbi:MAG: hypothetical protein ACOX05_07265 [Bacillota bacterium]